MANTPVEFWSSTGLTLTLKLFPYGSDIIANGASGDAATEATNRKGLYTATVAESITGWHTAHVFDGSSNLIAIGDVYLEDDTDIHRVEEAPRRAYDETANTLGSLASTLSTISTSISSLPTVSQIWTTALTEAYRSAGSTGTAAQLMYEILQNLTEFSIASTTKTVKKLDGSTTAKTYTLDSNSAPTSITETT